MVYFISLFLVVLLSAFPLRVEGGVVEDIFYRKTLINNTISADNFLQKFHNRNTPLATIEKREIVSTLSDTTLFGLRDFGFLINYAILLDKCGEQQLRDYYLRQIKERYYQDPVALMIVYMEAVQNDWTSVVDAFGPLLQRYRLMNHYKTIHGLSDLMLTHIDLSGMGRDATELVVEDLRKFNSPSMSVFIYQLLKNATHLRFASMANDLSYIWMIFTTDFYNFNLVLINILKFIAQFLTLLFIIFSLLILIRRRTLVYHFFIHYLPSNAPLGYHRFVAILGLIILYNVLGIIGVIVLFGIITAKYLSVKERRLLTLGGLFFLLNIIIFQAVFFLYIPLDRSSPYFMYYKSYIEGFNPTVLMDVESHIAQGGGAVHPLFFAAAAHQERKRGNYLESLRYWYAFEKEYGMTLNEVELNKANLYFLLNRNREAKAIFDVLTARGDMPEAFYNVAKLYLVNFEIDKYHSHVNTASSLSNIHSIPKYIFDNNKYLGSEKASHLIDVSIPNKVLYEFLLKDAFDSRYTISGVRQLFVFARIFFIIFFVFYCALVRKKVLKVCKICGMQICYDCQTKDMVCAICNARLENVKSVILQNKIKIDLAIAAKAMNFKILKLVSLLMPGSYHILNGVFRITSFLKIILVSLLLTLLFHTFVTMSIFRATSFISFDIKVVAFSILAIVFLYNAVTNIKRFRMEKESINKFSGF